MTPQRIVVAMSGGVDSSAAAAILVDQGHDVVGVTLRLYDATGAEAVGRCCGPRDIEDARATAAHLGIAHHVVDETELFASEVVAGFVDAHAHGLTPNPCVTCNERIKFGPLLKVARALGASRLATGHYARLAVDDAGQPILRRAVDRDRDQSYFLFGVRPEWLRECVFPLGDLTKPEVRQRARAAGLANADKADSHEICFIPDGDHRRFVEARGGAGPAGEVVDGDGVVLGRHGGTHGFTPGQRKGVPAGQAGPRFVVRIDAATGRVVVGPREAALHDRFRVDRVRWLAGDGPDAAERCRVQIRHHAADVGARLRRAGGSPAGDDLEVQLDEGLLGVAPGQAAVFFDGDRVLGGGRIVAVGADAVQPGTASAPGPGTSLTTAPALATRAT